MPRYGEAIRKPFSDPWKLAIGIILSAVPILNWIARGYIIESSGTGKAKQSDILNEWEDWWELFIKGIVSILIQIAYIIPAFLVAAFGFGGLMISMVRNLGINAAMLSNMPMASERLGREIASLLMSSHMGSFLAILLVSSLLALIAVYTAPIGILNYLRSGSAGAAFRLGEVFGKAFTWQYFSVWLASLIVSGVLVAVLGIVPFFGIPAAGFISGIFAYTLYGEAYRSLEGTEMPEARAKPITPKRHARKGKR